VACSEAWDIAWPNSLKKSWIPGRKHILGCQAGGNRGEGLSKENSIACHPWAGGSHGV